MKKECRGFFWIPELANYTESPADKQVVEYNHHGDHNENAIKITLDHFTRCSATSETGTTRRRMAALKNRCRTPVATVPARMSFNPAPSIRIRKMIRVVAIPGRKRVPIRSGISTLRRDFLSCRDHYSGNEHGNICPDVPVKNIPQPGILSY